MGPTNYLGIDVGGSKTLVAAFSSDGKIEHEFKFKTNTDYSQFLNELKAVFEREFKAYSFEACGLGAPAELDRTTWVAKRLGNLPWINVPLREDVAELTGLSVFIENDANLAGLSEALLIQDTYKRVVYVTLSRGIGGKLIINGKISQETPGAEVGFMMFDRDGKLTEWEEFASGDALMKKYGKKASEIEDPAIWHEYSYAVATGIEPLLSIWQPDAVVIGGGVGAHFEKFKTPLEEHLKNAYSSLMVSVPPLLKAQRPEEAVIYGCYDYIKQSI